MSTKSNATTPNFQSVIDRLKVQLGLPSNKAVAEAMGLTASNLGERKTRDALPVTQIEALCRARGINAGWVFEGVGQPLLPTGLRPAPAVAVRPQQHAAMEPPGRYAPPLDVDLMSRAIEAVELALDRQGLRLGAIKRSRLYKVAYEMSLTSGTVSPQLVTSLLDLARSAND